MIPPALRRLLGPLGRQVIVFGLVGVAATTVHVAVALAARRLLGASPLTANFCGYSLASLVSYFGHAHLTFQVSSGRMDRFLKFLAASLAGLGLGQFLTWLLVERLGGPFELGLAVVVVVVPVFSFVTSRLLVFRER